MHIYFRHDQDKETYKFSSYNQCGIKALNKFMYIEFYNNNIMYIIYISSYLRGQISSSPISIPIYFSAAIQSRGSTIDLYINVYMS